MGPEEAEQFRKMDKALQRRAALVRFLSFFLAQPVGLKMMVFDTDKGFDSYIGRQGAIDEALLTWFAMKRWERDSKNQLPVAVSCAGFWKNLPKYETNPDEVASWSLSNCMCAGNVRDPSGCCHIHRKPTSHTLFNHYPFFASEGHPELAGTD